MEENITNVNEVPEMEPKKRPAPPKITTRQQMLDAFKEMRKLPKYKPNDVPIRNKSDLVSHPELKTNLRYMIEKKAFPVHAIPQLLIDHGMPRFSIKEINDLLAPHDAAASDSDGSESSAE